MSETSYNGQTVEKSASFACESCGAMALYDPESGKLKCPYCGHMTDIDTVVGKQKEYALDDAPTAKQKDWGTTMRVVHCESCGAQTVLEKNQSATVCAFCGSTHVLDDQAGEAGIAPESLIPFHVAENVALPSFRRWLKRKPFAPSGAKKASMLGQITGVYLPHWTYDSDCHAVYTGEAGHAYYVTVTRQVQRDGKTVTEHVQERRIRWSPTRGVISNYFDDVLIAGSKRLDEGLLSRVRPFDLSKLAKYQPGFVSGFVSEKPSVTVQEGWAKAEDIIESKMRSLAQDDIIMREHADEARVHSISCDNRDVKYKLTLLPMYISSFGYKKKTYHVLVNGQTGKVGGQAPVSPIRVCIAIALGIALIALLYWLYTTYFGGDVGDVVSSAVSYWDY